LLWGLYRIGVYRPAPGWGLFGLRLLAGCAAMVALVWWLNAPSAEWFAWGWQRRAAELSLLVGGGIAVYVAAMVMLGLRMRHLRH
jgi:putative peptidoglycan lipid II flippase